MLSRLMGLESPQYISEVHQSAERCVTGMFTITTIRGQVHNYAGYMSDTLASYRKHVVKNSLPLRAYWIVSGAPVNRAVLELVRRATA